MRADYRIAVALASAWCLGCGSGAARPQLVVAIDTDLPVVGQLAADPEISPDAAVDTLLVDVMHGTTVEQTFSIIAPEVDQWPLSFGVAAPTDSDREEVRLRLRLFRGRLAQSYQDGGDTVLEPPPGATVDRLVDLPLPDDGIEEASVLLAGDCMGAPPSFLEPASTCIEGGRDKADTHDGVGSGDDGDPTLAGTWPRARAQPCGEPPMVSAGALCIPGGFMLLGAPALDGVADGVQLDAVPLRPAHIRPFYLDVTEMPVVVLRPFIQAGLFSGATPLTPDPDDPLRKHCTWLGPGNMANDLLPLNCITHGAAQKACQLLGGSLPSEAQWELAARGRGQGRPYPWGSERVRCCASAISRDDAGAASECEGPAPAAVGVGATGICEVADVSRDGVLDMLGNVAEHTRDMARPYDHPCWSYRGVATDPVCQDDTSSTFMARGASWADTLADAHTALRHPRGDQAQDLGLRCAYPGDAQ